MKDEKPFRKISKLDTSTIEEYALLKLQCKDITQQTTEFSDGIKEYMLRKGTKVADPRDSMYRLRLTTYIETDIDWRSMVEKLAAERYGEDFVVTKAFNQLRRKFSKRKPIARLEPPDLNPKYLAEKAKKLERKRQRQRHGKSK